MLAIGTIIFAHLVVDWVLKSIIIVKRYNKLLNSFSNEITNYFLKENYLALFVILATQIKVL